MTTGIDSTVDFGTYWQENANRVNDNYNNTVNLLLSLGNTLQNAVTIASGGTVGGLSWNYNGSVDNDGDPTTSSYNSIALPVVNYANNYGINSYSDVDFSIPEITYSPISINLPSIVWPELPVFDASKPAIIIPDLPEIIWPSFTEAVPTLSGIDIPTAPDINLPDVPVLDTITVPSPPDFFIDTFEGEFPVTNLTPPTLSWSWAESRYGSRNLDKVKNVLYADLIANGEGLSTDAEQAIYDRASSRLENEIQTMYDNALDFFASRGYPAPPGMLQANLLEADNKALQVREDLSNDILIQQSKLALDNKYKALAACIEHEGRMISYESEINERAFKAAVYVQDTLQKIYQLTLEEYKAKLSAYTVQAEVYRDKIQAEVAKAELYKSQVLTAQVTADVQRTMISSYTAQVEGVKTLIDVYNGQINAARAMVDVDKAKLEAFIAYTQGYTARIQAIGQQYEAYNAGLRGELTKVEMYKGEVEAYNSRVQAYKSAVDAAVARLSISVEEAKVEVENYKARTADRLASGQIAFWRSSIPIEKERADAAMKATEATVTAANLGAQATIAVGKLDATVNSARALAEQASQQRQLQAIVTAAQTELQSSIIRAQATVNAAIAAQQSYSTSNVTSVSNSNSNVKSDSTSRSASDIRQTQNIYQVIHED